MSAYRTTIGHVVALLTSDEQLAATVPPERIYEGLAPQTAAYPLVTIQSYVDPTDTNYNGGRALTEVDLLIRVWDESPASNGSTAAVVWAAADRIDAILTAVRPTRTGTGTVSGYMRVNEVEASELRGSATVVRSAGGRYKVIVT